MVDDYLIFGSVGLKVKLLIFVNLHLISFLPRFYFSLLLCVVVVLVG